MTFSTLISVPEGSAHLDDANWAFVDCRAALGKPDWGRHEYEEQHIPGAVYADLELELSGSIVPGITGRHPLPEQEDFAARMSGLGIDASVQVVAYDEISGAMAAARLWWLLRWAGHEQVAVLDGGLTHWLAAGLPTAAGSEHRAARHFNGRYQPGMIADSKQILASFPTSDVLLIDVRAAERYRGEQEPIDPVAGHIPGALSLPYSEQLAPDGSFLTREELQTRFSGTVGSTDSKSTVFYCGSGVTAAHQVLAYAHAGLGMPRLYPGSWSEWIVDPTRPRS